jgi:Lrp/AsnC family transcriptional regulator, leucine-responsive regulatory protein
MRKKKSTALRRENPPRHFDAIDKRIMEILQKDSLIANQDLAEKIGLSPPACLKRVRQLRRSGFILRTVSLLSPALTGCPLLTVIRVKLELHVRNAAEKFEKLMASQPRVLQCLMVAGDFDYVLLVRSRDVNHYQEFAREVLAIAPGIRSYASEIVLSVSKDTTEIPLNDASVT